MGRRLLFVPLPFQGHLNPMFDLASLLHSRGFAITILHTHLNSPDPDKYPESYRFIPFPDNVSDQVVSPKDAIPLIHALNKNCEAPFRDCLDKLLSEEEDKEKSKSIIACVIFDAHWYALQAVAKKLGVATMVLRTGSAASFLGFMAFPLLLEKGYYSIQESQSNNTLVSELSPIRVKDLARIDGNNLESIFDLLTRGVEQVRTSSGLILNTFDSIESTELDRIRQDLSIPVYTIGPLHKLCPPTQTQDESCMAWLNLQAPRSVIYVSFGTLAIMDPNELVEIAWGLASSSQPFLWVVRPGLIYGSNQVELPEGFEEATRGKGRVVDWAPQREVLGHSAVGGFWTHCGWNSTLEAICEGVPMLCRPFFGDQMGNGRYASHVWKVGIAWEGEMERGRIEKAIRRLMVEREGEEMRERMEDLKVKAAQCIKKGGSSFLAIDNLVDNILGLKASS